MTSTRLRHDGSRIDSTLGDCIATRTLDFGLVHSNFLKIVFAALPIHYDVIRCQRGAPTWENSFRSTSR